MITIRNTQERALSGKVVDEKEFDQKILPTALRDLVKKYDIKYNRNEIIPLDPDIPEKVFKAALDLIADVGLFCPDTGRTVTFTHNEVLEALRSMSSVMTFGEGHEAKTIISRKPGDTKPYLHTTGCGGTVISEKYYIPTQQAMARVGDAVWGGILRRVGGLETKAGFPSEILAGMTEGTYMREAVRRAGKPGMALCGVHSVSTPQGAYAGFFPEGYRAGVDIISTPFPVEMRLTMGHLARSLWAQQRNIKSIPWGISIYGGIPGPIEATTVCAASAAIAEAVACDGSMATASIVDRFGGCTRREVIWGKSAVDQAWKRHADVILWNSFATCGGACTDLCLYEGAAGMIADVWSGADCTWSVVALGGFLDDCQTPLEMGFGREVAVATQGWAASDLNELLLKLVAKYEDKVDYKTHQPRGKLLPDCYDVSTMTPSEEWWGIYLRVKDELQEMGIVWPEYSRVRCGAL